MVRSDGSNMREARYGDTEDRHWTIIDLPPGAERVRMADSAILAVV